LTNHCRAAYYIPQITFRIPQAAVPQITHSRFGMLFVWSMAVINCTAVYDVITGKWVNTTKT